MAEGSFVEILLEEFYAKKTVVSFCRPTRSNSPAGRVAGY
jgi:hypothetical protein